MKFINNPNYNCLRMKRLIKPLLFILILWCIAIGESHAQQVGYPGATWDPSPNHYTTVRHKNSQDVTTVVIHTTEGSFASSLSWLQNPASEASSNYMIRSSDGYIVQLVDGIYGAWHSGNGTINKQSIGIEQEGYADDPSYFTPALYTSTSNVTRWSCNYWGIAKTRVNIIGHQEVPDPNDPNKWGGISHHYDPGAFYDWDHLMELITGTASTYQQVKITTQTLNARTRPNGPFITTVSKDQEYVSYYQDPKSGWYLIFIPGGNSKHPNGWISGSASYVSPVSCHNQIKTLGTSILNVRTKDQSTILDKAAGNQRFVSIQEDKGGYEFYTPASTNDTSGWLSTSSLIFPCDCTLPDSVHVNGGGTFCNSATLTATGGNGGTVYWQDTTRNGAKKDTPSTSQTVTSSGIYYFRAYNSCGWGPEDSVKIIINHPPNDSISVRLSKAYCDSAILEAAEENGETIYWQGTTRNGISTTSPSTKQTVTSSGTYYFRSHNDCGWGQEDSIIVTINRVDTSITLDETKLISNQDQASYQWVTMPGFQPIIGETNQTFFPNQTGNYALIITKAGCIDTSGNYLISNITPRINEFSIYPNPTNNYFTIKNMNPLDEKYQIVLVNELGQILINKSITGSNGPINQQINIERFSAGIYFLRIKSQSLNKKFKIIKN